MKKTLAYPSLGVFVLFLLFSCIKDTDFDQATDVTITPVVELDLIYFDLEAQDFFNSTTNTPILTQTDVTEISFLNDSGTQESLFKVDFLFNFTNSIPRIFDVRFDFLDEQNEVTYSTSTSVAAGSIANPELTTFLHTVEAPEISQLTLADRVAVTVIIPSADTSLQGTLNLKSKTTYFFEITERE